MDFNKILSKMLGNNKKFEEVQIDRKVIDEIVKIAINADPKEYVALLSGKIKDNILKITGLIFLPFQASNTSAVMQTFMMPLSTGAVGSVHSHPGPSNMPSNADLTFFGKNGYFHMIICRPYSEFSIGSYDAYGNPVPFVIKDLGDEVEIKHLDELDIDKELFDEELLAELEKEEALDEDENLNNNNDVSYDNFSDNNYIDVEPINNNEKPNIIDSPNKIITFTDNIGDNSMSNDNQKEIKNPEIVNNKAYMINLQIESNGKIINKELPLPPEYEEGDEIIVDVRTDQTPGDSIDEIVLNVKKSPENLSKSMEAESIDGKSSEELSDEIEQMEADIQKLKEENERLRKEL
ncbi:MAG: hypothetical protein E7Z84_01120 [Methanosphaera stadtmanae]|nr:hypothetical protein [Methanosphaera stadtmanae]